MTGSGLTFGHLNNKRVKIFPHLIDLYKVLRRSLTFFSSRVANLLTPLASRFKNKAICSIEIICDSRTKGASIDRASWVLQALCRSFTALVFYLNAPQTVAKLAHAATCCYHIQDFRTIYERTPAIGRILIEKCNFDSLRNQIRGSRT